MENSQNGFSVLLLVAIVAVIAIAAGGGYVYVTRVNQSNANHVVEKKENVTQPKPKSLGETDTAIWKTYRNDKCVFEIKYPEGYYQPKAVDRGISFATPGLANCKKNDSFCAEVENSDSPGVACYSSATMFEGKSFEQYLAQRTTASFPVKKILANNFTGYEIEESGFAGGYKVIYFLSGDNLVMFSVAKEGNDKGTAFIDKIVTTFKFIEPAANQAKQDTTADWQTYRNDEYGFEIKYPATFNSEKITITFQTHVIPHGTDLLINGQRSISDAYVEPLSLSFNVFPTKIDDLAKYVKDKVASAKELYNRISTLPNSFDYSEIRLGNTTGYSASYSFADGNQNNTEIFVQNSKKLIRIFYDSSDSKKVETIQKMLSTFKFIESDPLLKYSFGGTQEFSTTVKGYYTTYMAGIGDTSKKVAGFVMINYDDMAFKESLIKHNDYNLKISEDGNYIFGIGFVNNGKIECDNYIDNTSCIDDQTEAKILSSTPQNPVRIKLFIGKRDFPVSNLAYKVILVN